MLQMQSAGIASEVAGISYLKYSRCDLGSG